MTLGPMEFRGPSRGPMGFIGPIEMTLTNQFVEDRRPFFFLEITSKSGENCAIFLFCFGIQNQRCLIFELTSGQRLALGAPVPVCRDLTSSTI